MERFENLFEVFKGDVEEVKDWERVPIIAAYVLARTRSTTQQPRVVYQFDESSLTLRVSVVTNPKHKRGTFSNDTSRSRAPVLSADGNEREFPHCRIRLLPGQLRKSATGRKRSSNWLPIGDQGSKALFVN
jgi:hypothetical protein